MARSGMAVATRAERRQSVTRGIVPFRGILDGKTVVVLGAGGLDYMRPRSLKGLPVTSVNSSARKWGLRPAFVVTKEQTEEALPNAAEFPDVPILTSRVPYGNAGEGWPTFREPNIHVYDHQPNAVADFDARAHWPSDPDSLVVSMSTMTTAMHFACYAGASVILVCGLVCGTLNGETHFAGYGHPGDPDGVQPEWMAGWLAKTEKQALAVRRELVRRYDVDILGLTPWITPELDGLTYRSPTNRINLW